MHACEWGWQWSDGSNPQWQSACCYQFVQIVRMKPHNGDDEATRTSRGRQEDVEKNFEDEQISTKTKDMIIGYCISIMKFVCVECWAFTPTKNFIRLMHFCGYRIQSWNDHPTAIDILIIVWHLIWSFRVESSWWFEITPRASIPGQWMNGWVHCIEEKCSYDNNKCFWFERCK